MMNNSSNFLMSNGTAGSSEKLAVSSLSAMAISWIVLGFISAALNILVCASVYFDNRLRTTTNYFVVSLSLADLLVSVVFIPVYIAEKYYTKTTSTGYFVAFILLASIFNLCAVTYERYIALTRPFEYKLIINCSKLCVILLVTWISPLFLALLPLTWGNNPEVSIHKIYLGIIVGVFIITPCTIMVYVYTRLLRVIRHFLLRNRRRITRGNSTGQRAGREVKSVKVFAMILGSFLLCWLPLVYINICDILDLAGFTSQNLVYVSFYTLVLNSILDPLIYALCKNDFKRSLRKKWASKCLCENHFSDDNMSLRKASTFSKASKIASKKETSL